MTREEEIELENEFRESLDIQGDVVIKGPGIQGEVTFTPSEVLRSMDINLYSNAFSNFCSDRDQAAKDRREYNAGN